MLIAKNLWGIRVFVDAIIIKRRLHWIKVILHPKTDVLTRKERFGDTEIHREEGHVMMEAESEIMLP